MCKLRSRQDAPPQNTVLKGVPPVACQPAQQSGRADVNQTYNQNFSHCCSSLASPHPKENPTNAYLYFLYIMAGLSCTQTCPCILNGLQEKQILLQSNAVFKELLSYQSILIYDLHANSKLQKNFLSQALEINNAEH